MKKQQVRDLIYATMSPIVSDYGFHLRKKDEEGFVRPFSGGKQSIGIPLWDYRPIFEFSLNVCIRFDAVENIINQFLGTLPKYEPRTLTFASRLDRFLSNEPGIFKIVAENDVQVAAFRLTPIIRDKIIPFFDRCQNLSALAEAMNLDAVPAIVTGIRPGMTAATVARLTGCGDFDSIVAAYEQRISAYPKVEQEKFKSFIRHLRDLSISKETQK